MDRPTREQIAEARTLLLNELGSEELAATMVAPVFDAVSVLLAATVEPTEAELADEAARAHQAADRVWFTHAFEAGYIAGARREGAR